MTTPSRLASAEEWQGACPKKRASPTWGPRWRAERGEGKPQREREREMGDVRTGTKAQTDRNTNTETDRQTDKKVRERESKRGREAGARKKRQVQT